MPCPTPWPVGPSTVLLAYKLCPAHIKFFIIANSLNKRMKGKRKESNKEST